MVAEPLQLPVTADADTAAGLHDLVRDLRFLEERILLLHEPATGVSAAGEAAPHATSRGCREHLVRREAPQLRVVVDVLGRVVVVLSPRPAVRDDERRRVRDAALGEQLHDVLVQRVDRQRVLLSRVPVHDHREVVAIVERALGGRHDLLLFRRLDDPLTLLAVTGHVHLERLRVVVLAVAPHDATRVLDVLDVLALRRHVVRTEQPGARRVDARADRGACHDRVLVREHVGRAGLRVARRGDAVREVREIGPRLLVHALIEPQVSVRIDEARHDGLAGRVDLARAVRHLE